MDQELREFLERRFGDMEDRFAELRQDVDRRITDVQGDVGGLRDDVTGLKGDVTGLREEVTGLRDEVHLTRVLVEKMNDKIDVVAEGVQANRETMYRLHEISRQELREFRDVMTASHRHLEGRVTAHDGDIEKLDNRVTFLEARKA